MTDGRLDLLAVQVFSWTEHLATTVEICLRHVAMGQRVGFVFLDVDNIDEFFPGFVPEPALWKWIGRWLRRTRRPAVQTAERILRENGVTVIPSPHPSSFEPRLSCRRLGIDSIDSLRSFRYEGAALGFGVLSSVIRHCADPNPDFEQCRPLIDYLLNSAGKTFALTRRLIERYQPTTVLVFNGRLTCSKAIAEAARLGGSELLYHEMGATHERFYLSNRPAQSAENARAMLKENWAAAGEDRESIAHQFFTRGRGGAPLLFTEFYLHQVPGNSAPLRGFRRIVYFVSSDDEHAAVEDGIAHPLFDSQRAAVTWLAEWVRDHSGFELIIRVHPRMGAAAPKEREWWDSLAGGNVTTIRADDPVDSYALASSADIVVCYRSTMGAEATYLGRVSIALGDAVYRGLDCVYEPRAVQEFEGMLRDADLIPKTRENCLPFGYHQMTRGTTYRFYKPDTLKTGRFFGESFEPRGASIFDRAGLKFLYMIGNALRPRARQRERSMR